MASTLSLRTRRMEEIWPPELKNGHVRRHVAVQHGFLNFVWETYSHYSYSDLKSILNKI